jgi:uncharacterized membrane protein YfcA
MQFFIWLLTGLLVGALGTLIGAGGGFLLMPLLLFVYRGRNPEELTAWSLAIVLCNSASGSIAYARAKRIDYRSGTLFTLAALPGAWFGAQLTAHLSRSWFALLFGVFLIAISGYLLLRSSGDEDGSAADIELSRGKLWLGAALSLLVGVISNVFGIGGGILHVPLLVYGVGFATHRATATSHFVLAITALVGVLAHVAAHSLSLELVPLLPLAVGATVGAQIGAYFSPRVRGPWIIRSLALGLVAVGIRLVLTH